MRKKTYLAGLAIVLAAIYPLASQYHGQQIQKRLDQYVSSFNQQLKQWGIKDYSITSEKISSGFFSTQYIFGIHHSEQGNIPLFHNEIEHGPFPIGSLKQGHLAPSSYKSRITLINNEKTAPLFEVFKVEEPFVIDYTYGYNHQIKGIAKLAPFSKTEKGTTISFKEFQLNFDSDKSFSDSSSQWNFGGFIIQNSNINITITAGNTTGTAKTTRSEQGFHYQTQSQTEGLSIHDRHMTIQADTLSNKAELKDNGTTINFSGEDSYKGISVNQKALGDLSFQIGYQDLDSVGTKALFSGVAQMIVDLMKNGLNQSGISEETIIQSHLTQLIPHIKEALKHSPTIHYGPIVHHNEGGDLSLKASVSFRFPDIDNIKSNDQLLQESIANAELKLQGNQQWLSRLAEDVLTIIAQEQGVEPPDQEDKKSIAHITADIQQALVDAQLVTTHQDDVAFSLHAEPQDKSFDKAIVTYNGEAYPSFLFLVTIQLHAQQFNELMEQKDVQARIQSVLEKYKMKK